MHTNIMALHVSASSIGVDHTCTCIMGKKHGYHDVRNFYRTPIELDRLPIAITERV